MNQKRKPGRPKGTSIDDSRYFNGMAALMVADRRLKKTTALKKFDPAIDRSTETRVIRKWNHCKDAFLNKASARQDRQKSRSSPGLSALQYAHQHSDNILAQITTAQKHLSLVDQTAAAMKLSAVDRVAEAMEMLEPMGVKLLRQLYNSPEVRLMREMRQLQGL